MRGLGELSWGWMELRSKPEPGNTGPLLFFPTGKQSGMHHELTSRDIQEGLKQTWSEF